jgi:alkanesulfonate monooxygenase SsuD/methylene tetrahydromethanopterin reductase-like flavin-dependent oxidoreductase (luciferase family)
MRVGIGLPSGIPGARGSLLLQWAARADDSPFSSVAVIDRVVYDNFEPFAALSAAAALTRRVRLATTIVVAPLRATALLAKSAASLDAISGGRLVMGMAVGAREDDYEAAGVDYHRRGRIFTDQLASLRGFWENDRFGPRPAREGGPELLVGGLSDAAFARAARYADGYIHGGGPPRAFARAADRARAAWRDAGRPGLPELWGESYFAIGEQASDRGTRYLKDYYAFTGPFAEKIAAGLLVGAQSIIQHIRGYEEAGCSELVLLPTVAEMNQFDLLAEVVAAL